MMRFYEGIEADELGRDVELAEALSVLDPARGDPNYWLRFRSWVMGAAARELAHRRLMAQLTVGDVMRSWARAVVPTALATAIFAGLLLIRGSVLSAPLPVSVEELLVSEIQGETIPMMVEADDVGAVTFAAEIF
jgi:hypothetical protein